MEKQEHLFQKIFQKMIELKIFHDRAKKKKELLEKEFKRKRDQIKKEKLKNTIQLLSNFEIRMEKSIASLKELNATKKIHLEKKNRIKSKIDSLTPKIKKQTLALEQNLFLFFDWTRYQKNIPKIEINGKAFQGTIFNGIFSSFEIESDQENFSVLEISDQKNNFKMELLKNEK